MLRALPLHSLAEDVRAEAERAIVAVHDMVVVRTLTDGMKQDQRRESSAWQFVLAGALRLHYGLSCAHGLPPQSPLDKDLLAVMSEYLGEEGVMPELVVEVVRQHDCLVEDDADLCESCGHCCISAARLPSMRP